MAIRPTGARVLVRRLDEPGGAVFLPDTYRSRDGLAVPAEVVAVGDGAWLETGEKVPVSVRPGDKVLVPPQMGYRVWEEGKEYVILNERDVVAVLE